MIYVIFSLMKNKNKKEIFVSYNKTHKNYHQRGQKITKQKKKKMKHVNQNKINEMNNEKYK